MLNQSACRAGMYLQIIVLNESSHLFLILKTTQNKIKKKQQKNPPKNKTVYTNGIIDFLKPEAYF